MAARKPTRIALIGTGGMAHGHAGNFAGIPGCRVEAAVDLDPDKVREFAGRFNIPRTYDSVEALLADAEAFDAVSVVTPDASHAPRDPCKIPQGASCTLPKT